MLINPYIYGGSSNNLVTTLYTGTSLSRSIITGQNLAGGGLVWIKNRTGVTGVDHKLFDTVRGVGKYLESNSTSAETTASTTLTNFNSNGFSLDSDNETNNSGTDYVAWSFLQKAGFLDIVSYTGNGTSQNIAHGLGATVGMIIIKDTSASNFWACYHRQLNGGTNPEQYTVFLNSTQAEVSGSYFNNTAPTTTQFSVGNQAGVNSSGNTYIAYLFAHNPAQKIYCGSFTTDGSGNATVTGLGFRPKWLLAKRTDSSSNWFMYDIERGWSAGNDARLFADSSDVEAVSSDDGAPTSNGFTYSANANSDFIFMAVG